MTNNKIILDQVKSLVSSKKINLRKKFEKKGQIKTNEQVIKKEIDDWIEKNADKICKEILAEHVKKIFK